MTPRRADTKNQKTMKLEAIVVALELKEFNSIANPKQEINGCCVTDIMSDALKSVSAGDLWVTKQAHRNTVAIASLRRVSAVVFSNGIIPDTKIIECATAAGITLLGTEVSTFEIAGRLYNLFASAKDEQHSQCLNRDVLR